jgi:uncharacterized protein YdeI (YjbR/CyaY-like superfamily)
MARAGGADGLPVLSFGSRRDWGAWLEGNHSVSSGVWLKIAKRGAGIESVSHAEALDDALRYGWIDGQRRALDGTHFLQRFTPRGPRSRWSKINRARAIELIDEGLMRPAGLAAVERARRNGSWDRAYEPQSTATVPDDLRAALDASPGAAALFARLDSRNRYAVLYRIQDAKRAVTRARRIQQFVAMLERGETLYP